MTTMNARGFFAITAISCCSQLLLVSESFAAATHIADDAALALIAPGVFQVAEGRIGNNALNGTHELDLGNNTGAPAVTAQYVWGNGVAQNFSLGYDSSDNLLTYTVASTTLTYTPSAAFSDIFIRTRATQANTSITVNDLYLNGIAVSDFSSSPLNIDPDILWISSIFDSNGDFLLTGKSTMSWTTQPQNSNLAYQIKLGVAEIPLPASVVLFASGLAGLFGARQIRRQR